MLMIIWDSSAIHRVSPARGKAPQQLMPERREAPNAEMEEKVH